MLMMHSLHNYHLFIFHIILSHYQSQCEHQCFVCTSRTMLCSLQLLYQFYQNHSTFTAHSVCKYYPLKPVPTNLSVISSTSSILFFPPCYTVVLVFVIIMFIVCVCVCVCLYHYIKMDNKLIKSTHFNRYTHNQNQACEIIH